MGGGLWEEYQQLEVLGKGAFGIVRKLHNRKNGSWAAVKVFVKSRFLDGWDKFVKGYVREIEIISSLNHVRANSTVMSCANLTWFLIAQHRRLLS